MLATFNPNNSSCISFSDPAFHIEQPKLLIIALEECAPPPRASHPPTTLYSDSFASSSSSSSSSSSYDSEDASAPDGEEEACTSYCSSDDVALDAATTQYIDDTFHVRMHRIEKWRGTTLPTGVSNRSPSPSSQKRKAGCDDDAEGICSPVFPRKHPRSTHSLGALSCPACDADFTSAHGLRMHGRASSSANDACRVAVEYGFE